MTKRIIIAGSLAQKPNNGGHAWVFLQYLLGFRRLGWEVLFLDQLEPAMCIDASGHACSAEESLNLAYFLKIMERFGLNETFALIHNHGEQYIGLSKPQVLERVRNADFLLNVMGYLKDREILSSAPRRVFLDIDPGFGQMWRVLGLHDLFAGHDAFVTIGLNIGRPECTIPTCGLNWITTPPPIVLSHWKALAGGNGQSFTSIASWRGSYGPVVFDGKTYGLRVHEFRKFARLPRLCCPSFQLALDIHPDEKKDLALLADNGWSLVDPKKVAADPWDYQAYIQSSLAEFMVAKNMYVQSQSGWFSDRSICYLASGKPVLVQDTGLGLHFPTDRGLLTFTTLEEAQAGVEEVAGNYARHSQAARACAEEYFDSDKVLRRLLVNLGVA